MPTETAMRKPINKSGKVTCPKCHGARGVPCGGRMMKRCPECFGAGSVPTPKATNPIAVPADPVMPEPTAASRNTFATRQRMIMVPACRDCGCNPAITPTGYCFACADHQVSP
jgi:hypothetical protein